MKVRYRHIAAYRTRGVIAPATETILFSIEGGYTARLTRSPDDILSPADRAAAVGSLLLQGLFSPDRRPQGSPEGVVEALAEDVRRKRNASSNVPSFLVLTAEGDVSVLEPTIRRESSTFDVCFDAVDKRALRDSLSEQLTASVSSVAVALPRLVGLETVSDAIVMYRDDGKQFISLSFGASGTMIASTEPTAEELAAVANNSRRIVANLGLGRVYALFSHSLQTSGDPLRAFLSAWTALEILVNKLFAAHSGPFYDSLRHQFPSTMDGFMARIADVMRDKYRLSEKFALVASRLSPQDCSTDLAEFAQAKRIRDRFAHGEDVDLDSLPVDVLRRLLRKYILLQD